MTSSIIFEECKTEQNSELELLQSMYSENELQFSTDPEIDGDVEFQLKATVEVNGNQESIEVTFQLPSTYPKLLKPSVFVRLPSRSSAISRTFNENIRKYIDSEIDLGEACVTDIIVWIQEKAVDALALTEEPVKKDLEKPGKFVRLWIYSHHLYSKFKRRDLLNLGVQFDLTGFTLPGKPGIICVEGEDRNCSEFWDEVRSWNWKKIMVKHREEGPDAIRRFGKVEEMAFFSKSGQHMDMGQFRTFLSEHQSDYMFRIFFGFD